jgi:tripartite-type tricarboxylate transporter receptor subunit TctC
MKISCPRITSLAVSCLMCVLSVCGSAQNYPAKVVRLVVPFTAGSGTDTVGRLIGGGLTQVFGQQVIVENRAGASGMIGTEFVAKAPPDGYTMLLINQGHAANVSLQGKLAYDSVRDFAPVTQLVTAPALVVVHPSLPVKSISELVKLAKAKPGAINYSTGGTGTPTFIAAALFKAQAGIDMLEVPYKAGGEALTGILAGETSVYFSPLAVALPHIGKQGRLRALAVTSSRRVPALPEVPTVIEAGYPGYQYGNWYGLVVPAKVPKETITIIHNAAVSALNNPGLSKRLGELGYVSIGDQPEEFAAHIKSEIEKLAKILR